MTDQKHADLAAVLAELEAAGSEQTRKTFRRHGANGPLFGVNFGTMRPLAKRLGRQQPLADGLWESGNVDARMLAFMVAEPEAMTERQLDAWLRELDYYAHVDVFVGEVAGHKPGIERRMRRWMRSRREWTAQAGWDLLSHLALGVEASDELCDSYIDTIEAEIGGAQNRVRHAMNGALIAIGLRGGALERRAIEAARRIGPVEVDHGETNCQTPAAEAYIERSRERAHARRRKAMERHQRQMASLAAR